MLNLDYTELKPTKFLKDSWCMYFWIPQEIHMKKGKMAGQVAHASARLARMMTKDEWNDYETHEVKIVYKVIWEKYTVFGIATKRNLKNKKWKLA